MIRLLELKHFKCFELLRLPLGNLTILSGTNASGKSSVLQSLMLLHQTMRDHEWSNRLVLNGNIAQVGTVSDIVDQVTSRERFEIGVSDDEVRCNWEFSGERGDMSANVVQVAIDNDTMPTPPELRLRWLLPHGIGEVDESILTLSSRIRYLDYISAERDGPREAYPILDKFGIHGVGSRGEYAVSALFHGGDEYVADELRLQEIIPTLSRQVEGWMDGFFPGCRLEVSRVANTNTATLGIRTSDDTGFLRPIHCGFGITQILPIIVAVLTASVNHTARPSLILIENPEVHLHPAGQALMGSFLAKAAHYGVQLIVETHSDHVLNGVRRAVKSGNAEAGEIAIHFLQDRFTHESQVISPVIDSAGNIDAWPEGFFDQFDKDLNYFAGWGE